MGDRDRRFAGERERDLLREVGDLERDFLRATGDLERDFLRVVGDLERDFLRDVGDLERDFLCEAGDVERDFERDLLPSGLRDLDCRLYRMAPYSHLCCTRQRSSNSHVLYRCTCALYNNILNTRVYLKAGDRLLFFDDGEGDAERRDFAVGEEEGDERSRFLEGEGEHCRDDLSGTSLLAAFPLSESPRSYLASVVGEGERLLWSP